MSRYSVSILFFLFISFDLLAAVKTDDDRLLLKLDKMIQNREVYQRKVEKEIADIRRTLDYVEDDKIRFDILGNLFTKYRSFRIDTAMIVAKERLQLAETLKDKKLINQGVMNIADVMNKMGKQENALIMLGKVERTEDVKRDTYFYYLYQTIYLSCYNDAIDEYDKQFAWQQIKAYKDTSITISDPHSSSYITNKCGRISMSGKWNEAIRLLEDYYGQSREDNSDKARMEYLLAELYLGKKDTLQAKHYLILASMTDIANAKKVYMSLQHLAILLFWEGDIVRAYNYISCSLEDVNFGKARYRVVDIAGYLPIIQGANDARIKADENRVLFFLLILLILTIILVVAFLFIRKKNTRILKVKQSLAEQNLRLREMSENLARMNEQIQESNHIKEEYIGLLFNICSENIYKQESNRKALLKIANTGSMSDISKTLCGQSSTSEDFKLFIRKFDTIFLSIFPNFVESFNTLLREEEQVQVKEGELLTPELRIYALIRLGINDNSKIANFLHYSLQTVYNYQMKMRNKAIIPGNNLTIQVQKL